MFTGIIEEQGTITAWVPSADAARVTVRAPLAVSDAKHGDSISVNGGVSNGVCHAFSSGFTRSCGVATVFKVSDITNPV